MFLESLTDHAKQETALNRYSNRVRGCKKIKYSAKRRRGTAACQLWLPDQALGLISVDIRLFPHRYCICNISSSTVQIVRE